MESKKARKLRVYRVEFSESVGDWALLGDCDIKIIIK